jgi:hypothetical protein
MASLSPVIEFFRVAELVSPRRPLSLSATLIRENHQFCGKRAQPVLWKIYARESFDTEDSQEFARECYQAGVIAVGWSEIGNLNAIPTREKLFDLLWKKWGHEAEKGDRAVAQWQGALWAFRTDVNYDDFVVCPDRNSDQYYVGRILSNRAYYDKSSLGGTCHFAHRRKVKWFRILNRAEIESVWPDGQFGGLQTVSRIHTGADQLLRLLNKKRRSFAQRSHLPVQPDMEWGAEAENRAMAWLREQGLAPVNEAPLNKGWDIRCGDLKFEVKGRKSRRTAIRLSQNEWAAAKRLKKQYTILIFTAATKHSLKSAMPQQIVDPTSNPESWKERVVLEYVLVD